MKVRVVTSQGYTSRHGDHFDRDDVADLPDELAEKLIRHRIAERIEVAVNAAPEQAARTTKPRARTVKRG